MKNRTSDPDWQNVLSLVTGFNPMSHGFIDRGFVQLVETDIAEFNGVLVILFVENLNYS